MKRLLVPALALAVSGCGGAEPLAVVAQRGDLLTGQVNVYMNDGTFWASNGALTCGGSFDPQNTAPDLPISAICSDGRTLTGVVRRERSGWSGSGPLTFSDGEVANLTFGVQAGAFQPRQRGR